MKKVYSAPSLELLAFCSNQAIGANTNIEDWEEIPNNSQLWNDGELGGNTWT